jgi:O-succinylbenzoate synthase
MAKLELYRLKLRLKKGPAREIGILRYVHSDGRVGYGEASPLPELGADFAPAFRWGLACARAMALDQGGPVSVQVHGLIPLGDAAEAVLSARRFEEAGYTHVKVKLSDRESALRILAEIVRDTKLRLRLDAGSRLSFEDSLQVARQFRGRIDYFEDPFHEGERTYEQFFAESGVTYAIDLREPKIRLRTGLKAFIVKPTVLGCIPEAQNIVLSSAYESALGLYQIAAAAPISGHQGLDTADIFVESLFEIKRRADVLEFPTPSQIRARMDSLCSELTPSARSGTDD